MKAEFKTVSDRFVSLLDLRPEDVEITDVAHHLSWTCRYNGAIEDWYNNGQHSVLASEIVEQLIDNEDVADAFPELRFLVPFATLIHDGSEAYTGDVTRPMKNALRYAARIYGIRSPIDVVEDIVQGVIEQAFYLPRGTLVAEDAKTTSTVQAHLLVKRADNLALTVEDAALRPAMKCGVPDEVNLDFLNAAPQRVIWTRHEARAAFLERFELLNSAWEEYRRG